MHKDILDLDPKGKRKDKVQYYSLIKNDPSIMGKLYELQIDANTVKDSDVLQDEVMKLTDILKATMKEENDKG
jgi:hypothetical protein